MYSLGTNWSSYIFTGTLAVILSWALSGCRLGNHVEEGPTPPPSLTGYYETAPQQLTFCTTLKPDANTVCNEVSVNLVPGLISSVMGNPIAFQIMNDETGEARFFYPFGSGYTMPVYVNKDTKELSYIGSTQTEVLWIDPACTTQLYLEEKGMVNTGASNTVQGLTTVGRIALDIKVYSTYEGTCDDSLLDMENCFFDSNQCGGADATENGVLQTAVQNMYNPYIQAGVIKAEDISNISSLGYTVSYK